MNCTPSSCNDCVGRVLCRCLRVTEEAVVEAVTKLALETVQEVRAHTGAGEGCTACLYRVQQVIERHSYASSSSPVICSVR